MHGFAHVEITLPNYNQATELGIVVPNEYPCLLEKLKRNFVESSVNEDWCDKEFNLPGYKDLNYNCMDETVSAETEGCTNCLPCTVVQVMCKEIIILRNLRRNNFLGNLKVTIKLCCNIFRNFFKNFTAVLLFWI